MTFFHNFNIFCLNYQKVWKLWFFFTILIFLFNPLTTNDGLLRYENMTFLWTWTQRWVPRSFATHVSFCNSLPSNKLCTKMVKIPVVKGLNYQKVWKLGLFFTILIFLFKPSTSMKICDFFFTILNHQQVWTFVTFFHNFNIFVYPFNYQWRIITSWKFDLFVDLDTEVGT